MQGLDPHYPVFVLAFCIFYKPHYYEDVVPALHKLKFKYFGHDLVILHEHEIRKEQGAFNCFINRQHKNQFLNELTSIIDMSHFALVSCVVDKCKLQAQGNITDHPYHLALGFCLETLYEFLVEHNQVISTTHVIVECRGKKEDKELGAEFRRICERENHFGFPLPFKVVFADKKVDSPGLQLADLVARPIGMSVVRKGQENRAFDVLKRKFFCRRGTHACSEGYNDSGLKLLPALQSEKPRQ